MVTAVLVIDMQNDFLDQFDDQRRTSLIHATNTLTQALRNAGFPVIWVRQEFEPNLEDAFLEMRRRNISKVIKGTLGAELDQGLSRNENDTSLNV